MPDYNHIVWIYDRLAKFIFGKKQELAKQAFLIKIPEKAKILIVGGGTGKILDYLRDLDKQLEIDFVDLSANMIFQAKKRDVAYMQVNFYQQSVLDLKTTNYDVVITNFFFDQFSYHQANLILQNIKLKIKPKGILIFSDFINTKYMRDKVVTRIMFFFFKLTAKIRTNTFPPYDLLFFEQGFYAVASKKISRNILATTYSILSSSQS